MISWLPISTYPISWISTSTTFWLVSQQMHTPTTAMTFEKTMQHIPTYLSWRWCCYWTHIFVMLPLNLLFFFGLNYCCILIFKNLNMQNLKKSKLTIIYEYFTQNIWSKKRVMKISRIKVYVKKETLIFLRKMNFLLTSKGIFIFSIHV